MTASELPARRKPLAAGAESQRAWSRRLHLLLAIQSLLWVLASINRLWDETDAVILPHGALRVVDFLNLLVIVPAIALVFYLLLEHVLPDVPASTRRTLRLAFLVGLYLFSISYGMHEPANYLNTRFCAEGEGGRLCEIVVYHDDELSHLLYFAGLIGINVALLLAQARATTLGAALSPRDRALVVANASIPAVAIIANLGLEEVGLDLVAVAVVAALALYLLRRYGPRALILYFAWAYGFGLAGSLAIKAI